MGLERGIAKFRYFKGGNGGFSTREVGRRATEAAGRIINTKDV